MQTVQNLSLISGPIPVLFGVLGVAAVLFLLFRRSWRWWLFALAAAAVALLVGFGSSWLVIYVLYWWPEDLPTAVALYVALMVWALLMGSATAYASFRRRRPVSAPAESAPAEREGTSRQLRRAVSPMRGTFAVLAVAVVAAVVGVGINADFGQYPTLGSLMKSETEISTAVLPKPHQGQESRFMKSAVSTRWTPSAELPVRGTVRLEPIPGTISGFKARKAVVYLPPAYSEAQRPVLPVLVMVSGQPGSPESWLSSTGLVNQLDAYAASHGGLAPIVVIPDPNGSTQGNTMCMDSKLGQADSYMSKDVPAWIKSHLEVDTNPAHWAVGGFSYGATCSLQMVTRHPQIYQTFMAISPEREPALAVNRSLTVDRAFNGDTAAFDALLPLTLMAHNTYPQIHGWFAVGNADTTYSANVKVLEAAASKAGMSVKSASYPGGHSWAVADAALPQGLAFVFARVGLP